MLVEALRDNRAGKRRGPLRSKLLGLVLFAIIPVIFGTVLFALGTFDEALGVSNQQWFIQTNKYVFPFTVAPFFPSLFGTWHALQIG